MEKKNEEEVEKTNPSSNRFLTSCFLTLARPKKNVEEERSRGGRAKEALCLEVSAKSSACVHAFKDINFSRLRYSAKEVLCQVVCICQA